MKSVPPRTVGFEAVGFNYKSYTSSGQTYGLAHPGFESWQGPEFHLLSKISSLSLSVLPVDNGGSFPLGKAAYA